MGVGRRVRSSVKHQAIALGIQAVAAEGAVLDDVVAAGENAALAREIVLLVNTLQVPVLAGKLDATPVDIAEVGLPREINDGDFSRVSPEPVAARCCPNGTERQAGRSRDRLGPATEIDDAAARDAGHGLGNGAKRGGEGAGVRIGPAGRMDVNSGLGKQGCGTKAEETKKQKQSGRRSSQHGIGPPVQSREGKQ